MFKPLRWATVKSDIIKTSPLTLLPIRYSSEAVDRSQSCCVWSNHSEKTGVSPKNWLNSLFPILHSMTFSWRPEIGHYRHLYTTETDTHYKPDVFIFWMLNVYQHSTIKSYMHPNVHSSTLHNSQDMEATWMSINTGMDKGYVAQIYNGILLSHKIIK